MALLFVLVMTNSITWFALSVLLLRSIWSLATNVTTIETWEIERHETLLRRARASGGYLDGPDGVKVRITRQEFPYDIGIIRNICQGMGSRPSSWLWPLATTLSNESGLQFETNGFEGMTYAIYLWLDRSTSQTLRYHGLLQTRIVFHDNLEDRSLTRGLRISTAQHGLQRKSSLLVKDSGRISCARSSGESLFMSGTEWVRTRVEAGAGAGAAVGAAVGVNTRHLVAPSMSVKKFGEILPVTGSMISAWMRILNSMTRTRCRLQNLWSGKSV